MNDFINLRRNLFADGFFFLNLIFLDFCMNVVEYFFCGENDEKVEGRR